MKSSIKFFAFIALFLTVSFSATAQQRTKGAPDLEKKVEKQTSKMVEELQLNEAQAATVQAINLTYAQKAQAAREENKDDREAMKEIQNAINSEKNAEMKSVLTDEQYESYEKMSAKKGNRKKGKKGNRQTKK